MPNINKILETMRKQGINEEIIKQLPMPIKGATREEVVIFIEHMDKLLSKEQCLSIMEEQGCRKNKNTAAEHISFGKEYANKSIEEKVKLFCELDTKHKGKCELNSDGTITIGFQFGGKGNFYCPCGAVRNAPKPCNISLTYCGCCAGHMKYLYQFSLGVKLRLKEIVSSMANSDGEKPCEFIYEIVD